MKPLIPILVVLGVIATFAVDDPNTAMAKPTPSDLVMTSDGVEDWNRRKIHYQLKGRENPNITFEKNREACSVRMDIDGVKRHLLIKDDEIIVNGRKFDTGSHSELSLNANKDFLIVKIVKIWSHSSSGSAKSSSTNNFHSTSESSSSSSQSSGKSLLALGFVDFAAGMEFFMHNSGHGTAVPLHAYNSNRKIILSLEAEAAMDLSTSATNWYCPSRAGSTISRAFACRRSRRLLSSPRLAEKPGLPSGHRRGFFLNL